MLQNKAHLQKTQKVMVSKGYLVEGGMLRHAAVVVGGEVGAHCASPMVLFIILE